MSAIITAAVALTVSTAYTIYSGERAAAAQKDALAQQEAANQQAQKQALSQAKLQEEATNKSMTKKPDTGAILSAAEQAGKAGASSTMLTGTSGVDVSQLGLGKKNTLLGG